MNVKGIEGYEISASRDGTRWYKFGESSEWKVCNSKQEDAFDKLIRHCRKRHHYEDDYEISSYSQGLIDEILAFEDGPKVVKVDADDLKGHIKNLINFFSEFHFEPNFRFVNTFAYACNDNRANDYVNNYFKLTDSPYASSVSEKMQSSEWDLLVESFSQIHPTNKINKRFKLYFGSQGTGKTTLANKETDYCVVCHSAMLPSDLMEDFDFNDGKATFKPSVLYNAMVSGKKVTLDEINLLPFESLRFLQTILDGKKEFNYKGRSVKIHNDFSVIGTMNLVVNGCTYALPDPLVDRAYDLREFKLTEDNLVVALL